MLRGPPCLRVSRYSWIPGSQRPAESLRGLYQNDVPNCLEDRLCFVNLCKRRGGGVGKKGVTPRQHEGDTLKGTLLNPYFWLS